MDCNSIDVVSDQSRALILLRYATAQLIASDANTRDREKTRKKKRDQKTIQQTIQVKKRDQKTIQQIIG